MKKKLLLFLSQLLKAPHRKKPFDYAQTNCFFVPLFYGTRFQKPFPQMHFDAILINSNCHLKQI
ncbi:hypothetical protein [Enterococcus sp.]|uniref:hypothetical protein n=1 Tax=Enterococcus sp. TaxID=35783 RepID=UPI003C77F725